MQAPTRSIIRKLIESLAKGSSGSKFEEAARRLDALPLYEGWTGWVVLTDLGEVLEETDEGGVLSAVPEPLRTIHLVAGAERYPELLSLLPVRPPGSMECRHCSGTGWVEIKGNATKLRCGECRALGWVETPS
jgi:hypothetical protein